MVGTMTEAKKRYILVAHSWFVDGIHFQTKELPLGTTEKEAEEKQILWQHELDSTFHKTAVIVLPLEPSYRLSAPEKLTWKERWTGWYLGRTRP